MTVVVATIGAMMAGLGLVGTVAPGVFRAIAPFFQRPGRLYIAAAVRVVLGVLLIIAGPYCRPENHSQEIVRALGVLIVAAGFLIVLLGEKQVSALIDWWLARPTIVIRISALINVALGVYLMYASSVIW